ncbi:MAG: 4'-phosphopantetheinyl transferase family protein [Steroidobacteraceae bacterium]
MTLFAGTFELLTEEEWQCIRHCRDRRIQDFTAGRLCARTALQQKGMSGTSLLPGNDRQPLWPDSIVGSITHTDGYCAAVVGRDCDVRCVGLDSEVIGAVQPDVFRRICSPPELDRLLSLTPQRRSFAAALTFVAKEAFFKCQFPVAREWLDFDAVAVRADNWDADLGSFRIEPLRHIALEAHASPGSGGWQGRFRRHEAFVTAGMALPVPQ